MRGKVKEIIILLIIIFEALVMFYYFNIYIISKTITFETSLYNFQPSQNYTNVTYFMQIKGLISEVTVVIFNGSTPADCVSLFDSSYPGYLQNVSYFNLSGSIYSPNDHFLATLKNAKAFNITADSNYILFAKIKSNNTIAIWALLYYQGKWYRVSYKYLNITLPSFHVVVDNGYFALPRTAEEGFSLGFWFKEGCNSISGGILYLSVPLNGKLISLEAWQVIPFIPFESNDMVTLSVNTNPDFYYNNKTPLDQGSWYFVTINYFDNSNYLTVSVYKAGDMKPITTFYAPISGEGGGAGSVSSMSNVLISFQSERFPFGNTALISQAYFVSFNKNSNINSTLSKIFRDMFSNGAYFNNTANMNSIFNQGNVNVLAYWDFSVETFSTPSVISGWVWVSTTPQPIYPIPGYIYNNSDPTLEVYE